MNTLSKSTFQTGLIGNGGSMAADRLTRMMRITAPAAGMVLAACMVFQGFTMLEAGTQRDQSVAGQKLDSGLGDVPHYSQWTDRTGRDPLPYRVVGESLDSGLGELPHYSKWTAATAGGRFGEVLQVSRAQF